MVTRRTILGGTAVVAGGAATLTTTTAAQGHHHGRRRPVLIRGGYVLTRDLELGDLPSGDVLVTGDLITKVAPRIARPRGAIVIDAGGMLVAPGLVDNHRHLWSALLRGVSVDHTFGEYFGQILFGVQPRLQPDDLYLAGLLAAYEALDAGVTTILDWNHGCNTPEHAEQAVRALQEAGIRARFGYSSPASNSAADAPPSPEDIRAVHQKLAGDPLVGLAMATRNPDSATGEADRQRIMDDITLARELGIPVTLHTGFGGGDAPAWMAERGLIGPETTLIHGNAFTADDLRIIAEAGAWTASSPEVEMQMGLGPAPLRLILDNGVAPTVSVDILTAVTGDLPTQLRFILQTQRMFDHANSLGSMLPARDTLAYVTTNAAGSLGLQNTVGSLSPGKQADVILIDRRAPNLFLSAPETAMLHAHPGNVHTVLVAGNVVKRHGKLVGADLVELRRQAQAARDRLLPG